MHHVLITGATGLVGGHLLNLLRREAQVESIIAPTRHPLEHAFGIENPHDPDLSAALAQVTSPIDTVFCCLSDNLLRNLYTSLGCCRDSVFIKCQADHNTSILPDQWKHCIH